MRRFIQKIKECIRDNRGMTLIELLIAIAILGVVSGPLLHGFLTSTQTSVKSQKMSDVTMVAQSVMEIIEANEPDTYIEAGSDRLKSLFSAASAGYYAFSGTTYVDNGVSGPGANGDYHIGATGISAGAHTYNVMIDIDPSPYDTTINKEILSVYSPMNIVFEVPANSETTDRIITMDVKGVDTDGVVSTYEQVTIDVQYDISGTGENPIKLTTNPVSYQVTNGKMPSIYLLYYPNYKWVTTDGGESGISIQKDTIIIKNMQELEFDLFLVKQENESLSDVQIYAGELDYQCFVEQHLTHDYSVNKIGANIYSNIEEHLSYATGYINEKKAIKTFSYNTVCGTATTKTVPGTLGDIRSDIATPNALVKEEKREPAYEVTVKVFSSDNTQFTGEPLCTMTGTILK